MQKVTSYCSELEKKCYSANCMSLELLQTVRNLEAYIVDLRAHLAIYMPVANDAVDKKLAEYINNYPERKKLRIMFMRESEGVYHFG